MIKVTEELRNRLAKNGISTLHRHVFSLPDQTELEPPCSLKWMAPAYKLTMGAFSYAVSGYYFGAHMGRYVSIGEQVQVGRGNHPLDWASTSPVFYGNPKDVVDFDIPEAANFKAHAPALFPKETRIGNDVWIGHGAFIMQGVEIGDGAVVGAASVVTRDVPPYAMVAGSPAVIRKRRFADSIIDRMLRVAWWNYAFWDLKGVDISNPEKFLDDVEQRISTGLKPYTPTKILVSQLAV